MPEWLRVDKKRLLADLIKNYRSKHKKSEEVFKKTAQYFSPFPFYDVQSSGSKVWDADGNIYVDFWQGHFANVLGHNPQIIIKSLQDYFHRNQGLTTGFPGTHQRELAELILKQINADKIRFTTSGTLATMYAIMLAKAFTKRELVMKVGGGWHGAQPYALKGITIYDHGLNRLESAGLPGGTDAMIIVTRFNDIQDLENKFKEHGEKTACFIIEPFVGAGGFIFSHKDYLQKARELTRQYGTLLIFDEVVSGFRFHAGGVQSLYGIQPDLTVLGKAIGGGMPVSAVAGRDDVLALCGSEAQPDEKVKFEGGTFSAHPAAILAGLTHLKYFKCTGYGDSIAEHSSLVGVQFLKEEIDKISSPEQVWNPEVNDIELREKIFKLSMLEEGFNIFHGYGGISVAHSSSEIQESLDAVERIAKKWRKYI